MKCAWQELLSILPGWLSAEADKQGRESLQELRLRAGRNPELVTGKGSSWLGRMVSRDDLQFCINTASRYSPWAAHSVSEGYLTAPGGHRIGICGEAVVKAGEMTTIRQPESICIRVARDFPGIGKQASDLRGSILLIGPPGSGKTTLLRDLARQMAEKYTVSVVDERKELFPGCFLLGKKMDVLSGCPKSIGIQRLIRTMGPEYIVVDEITAAADCEAMLYAGWCGVKLMASAHAASVSDLLSRPVYRPLLKDGLFDHILVLSRDKSWREERMPTCI